MPSDLSYFRERDLDKTNIKDFYNSLPGHLQDKFQAAIHTNIAWGNVLQGYRGPSDFCNNGSGDSEALSSSCGTQEIKFWWGARKDLNAQIPVLGTGVFLLGRVIQKAKGELNWSSLYFDSKTGECLSHDKNEAAEKLNSIGCRLYEQGKYSEAAEYHDNAYRICSTGYFNEQTFKKNARKAESELKAKRLNSQADTLFAQARYAEALDKYKEAYDMSQDIGQYRLYRANSEKTQTEIDAIQLNSEGERLFNQGNYEKAHSKYQQACDTSQISKHKQVYQTNRIKAQAEIDAMNLNSQGNALFSQARYNESYSKYNEACNKSRVSANNNVYAANRSKAQAEINAIDLNSEGNDLFNRGNYEEAHSKYQQACNTSQIGTHQKVYEAKRIAAKAEIDAKNLNFQGDHLFNQGNYEKAHSKYQQAYDKSQTTREKDIYSSNREKVQTVLNKLSILDHLWAEAWDAENDTSNDRCEEAKNIFQRILNDCKDFLIIFPRNSKFEQYRTLALLKIQGNETFNQGIVLRQNGMTLFETAQQLRQQENYQLANEKFKEAKRYFQKAFEKFEAGKISDQRFESCIDFVQEHIKVVTESIEITEQCILRASLQTLDIDNGSNDHSARHSCESGGPAVYNNYSQHIS